MHKLGYRQPFEKLNIDRIGKVSDHSFALNDISRNGGVLPVIGTQDLMRMDIIKTVPDNPGKKKDQEDKLSGG